VFYVEILSVQGTRGWEKFCIDVGKEWMASVILQVRRTVNAFRQTFLLHSSFVSE
jgi:hypothetical protein